MNVNTSYPEENSNQLRQIVARRVNTQERFECALGSNPAPSLVLRLSDNTYIRVNHGFLCLTGYARDELIGKQFQQLDVLRGAEDRHDALVSLRQQHTIRQQEARLRVRDGTTKSVIVAGQPIDIADEACMLFTFIDMQQCKRMEAPLRDSEIRFSKVFQLIPVPMMVCVQPHWCITMVNTAFSSITGYAGQDVCDRTLAEIGLWKDARMLGEFEAKVDAAQGVRNYEVALRSADGAILNCAVSAEPVTSDGLDCVLCIVQDKTDSKRSEMELVAAIDAVMKDGSWFSHTVMEKLAQLRCTSATGLKAELSVLTSREKEILTLICIGKSNAEIVDDLALSCNTVRNHIANLYDKIGVSRRSAAVVWGRERGLVGY